MLNYKNFASIEITGRNDKTSVLDPSNNSYFYPGVSGSLVVTDLIPSIKTDAMNFLKLRASWNKTGNADINPYLLSATFSQGDGFPYSGLPGYSADNTSYDRLLQPEFIKSTEVGFEAGFLNNRIYLDATYYDQDNTNQIVNIRVPRSTGYTFAYVNAASFRNYGLETQLRITPLIKLGEWDNQLSMQLFIQQQRSIVNLPGSEGVVYRWICHGFKSGNCWTSSFCFQCQGL